MPITTRTYVRVGLATAAAIGVGVGVWRYDEKLKKQEALKRKKAAETKTETSRSKVFDAELKSLRDNYLQPGAPLAATVVDSLSYGRRYINPETSIGLNTRTQARVFDAAVEAASSGQTGDRENIDEMVRRLLRQNLPDCMWERLAWPLEPDSDFDRAYSGVAELFQLAIFEMRYGYFRELPDGSGAGVVSPGWHQLAPAPSSTVRPFDYVELMLALELADGDPIKEERVHALVTATNGDMLTVMLLGDGEALPKGGRTRGPQYGDHHGFAPDQTLSIPRRCVFGVIKK